MFETFKLLKSTIDLLNLSKVMYALRNILLYVAYRVWNMPNPSSLQKETICGRGTNLTQLLHSIEFSCKF